MNNIQTDLADEALVTAIRANLCEFFRHVSRSIPEQHFENEKFTRWLSSLGHPWFNGVLSLNPYEKKDEAFIAETIQYFRANKVGAFTWWMQPPLQRADWQPVLSKYGFGYSDDTPGMAANLEALNEPQQTVDGLEVRVVTDEESLHTWTHVFTLGTGLPSDWEASIYDLWIKLGLGFPNSQLSRLFERRAGCHILCFLWRRCGRDL